MVFLLPAFQSVYCYGDTFPKGRNKSCLLEGCQNPGMAALTERQQSPSAAGGAVIGPTVRAAEPLITDNVWHGLHGLQLGMDIPLFRQNMDVNSALQELDIVRTHSEIISNINRHLSFMLNHCSEDSSTLCRGVQ